MVDLVKIRKKAKDKKAALGPRPSALGDQPTTPPPPPPPTDKLARFLETAGQRPFTEAKREVETSETAEVLTFTIAEEVYGIAIDNVVEIVTPRAITRVPNADPSIVGILSLRGTIVTLIDVRRRLHHRPGESGPDTRVIVIEQGGEHVGFLVDRVLRVVKTDAGAIAPQPVVHASEQDESVRGVFRHNESLTILLDLEKVLERATGDPGDPGSHLEN